MRLTHFEKRVRHLFFWSKKRLYHPANITIIFTINPIHAHVHTADAFLGFVWRQLKYRIHPTNGIRNERMHQPTGVELSSLVEGVATG